MDQLALDVIGASSGKPPLLERSPEEMDQAVNTARVLARVAPRQKLKIHKRTWGDA